MANIIDALVQDLANYSYNDINLLARYYDVPRDLRTIAKLNLSNRFQARMYGNTFHTSQISDVVNILNNKDDSNICLRTALVIDNYTDKPTETFFKTMHLGIKPQEYDIYNKDDGAEQRVILGETNNPNPIITEILNMQATRYCFFVVWVKRDGYKPDLPVIESHITLVLCERRGETYDIYNYNSGITTEENEAILDKSIQSFFNLVKEWQSVGSDKNPVQYELIPTINWCPKQLQGTSNMCTVFVFNMYYYLNKYRLMSIQKILKKVQSMSNILVFLKDLHKDLPGTGEVIRLE